MEIIPFLIFAYVAFQIFKGFIRPSDPNSANAETSSSAKDLMQRLNQQMEQANRGQSNRNNSSPTQRGRESLARKSQSSPWNHEHDLGGNQAFSPGAQAAAKYLKTKTRAERKASHKSPVQRGRRGRNMDQNRNRTDQWGERGDKSFFNGKTILIFLVIGGAVLYALSNLPAA